jgi:2-polyprenyl-3-methyl-5-hydroxy-6-metoxy-1,4-benzoquinol methylase
LERQSGRTLEEINVSHVNRYRFAASKLKGRVLDAACGTGYGSRILFDAGLNVTGVDIHVPALEEARVNWTGPDYLRCDLNKGINGATWHKTFDGIVSFETIEHLQDPRPCLSAFLLSLEGGGSFICSVPNESKYPFNAANFQADEYPHVRHYTAAEFDALLEGAGFKIEERWCQTSKASEVVRGIDGMFLIYVCGV